MHMADALISPAVGGTMWAVTAAAAVHSARKLRKTFDEKRVPLMGVLGAFIFAAQMINFTIPATGSSGHVTGAMILSILLGPHAAFLTMASIITVQALFFADGGLLALGCNIFNMAFFGCFVAYPYVYRKIVRQDSSPRRILIGSLAAAILALQMGAFAVVVETMLSGISELPFRTFVLLMQPIHLAIGIVEGFVTAAVVTFVWKARPEVLEAAAAGAARSPFPLKGVLAGLLAATAVTAGLLSWFASSHPDGLEWSVFHTTGKEELAAPEQGIHAWLGHFQEKTAILPDYSLPPAEQAETQTEAEKGKEPAEAESWPSISAGTTVSGLVGAFLTLALAGLIGLGLRRYHSKS
jgi:cobalt/nickel transport system permease protein